MSRLTIEDDSRATPVDGCRCSCCAELREKIRCGRPRILFCNCDWYGPDEQCDCALCAGALARAEVKPAEQHPECSICRRRHGREVEHACE